MLENILIVLSWIFGAAILVFPLLCIVLYKYRKLRTCLVFSHLWCIITFCFLGMLIITPLRHYMTGRRDDACEASRLMEICKTLRRGDKQESIILLDNYMAGALYITAYDIQDSEMKNLDPEILGVWQKAKAYFDTYEVKQPSWGGMIPYVRGKLAHVPWSDMQIAAKKFDQTYGNGKLVEAPPVKIDSWITSPKSKDFKNKVILLDFWNIYCGPCVASFPKLQKIHERYKDKGLVVIACAAGDKEDTKAYLQKYEYTFPAGMQSRQMWLDYAVRSNPTYFLIDRDGNLAWGPKHALPTEEELNPLLEAE